MKTKSAITGAVAVVVLGVIALFAAGPAVAIDDIVIPIDTVVGGDPGEIKELARVTVDADLVGSTCEATLEADNNPSVHPDNDLIVTTGDFSATIPDVESSPGEITVVSGEIVLGTEVVVAMQFGPDGITSGGLTLTFDCEQEPTPTTTEAPATTTEAPSTTLPPAEVGGATEGQPAYTG